MAPGPDKPRQDRSCALFLFTLSDYASELLRKKYEKMVYYFHKALASFRPLLNPNGKLIINAPQRGDSNEVDYSIIVAFIFFDSAKRLCR